MPPRPLPAAHRVGELAEPPEPHPSPALPKLLLTNHRNATADGQRSGGRRALYTHDTAGLADLPLAVPEASSPWRHLIHQAGCIDRVPDSRPPGPLQRTLFLQFVVPVHTGASPAPSVCWSPPSLDVQFQLRGHSKRPCRPALPMRSGPGAPAPRGHRSVNPIFRGRCPLRRATGGERSVLAPVNGCQGLAAAPANQ